MIMIIHLYSAIYPNNHDHKRSPYLKTKKSKFRCIRLVMMLKRAS